MAPGLSLGGCWKPPKECPSKKPTCDSAASPSQPYGDLCYIQHCPKHPLAPRTEDDRLSCPSRALRWREKVSSVGPSSLRLCGRSQDSWMSPAHGTSLAQPRAPCLRPQLRADSHANPVPGWWPPPPGSGSKLPRKLVWSPRWLRMESWCHQIPLAATRC